MNRAPLWDAISRHKHLLGVVLEASAGRVIRQAKLYEQLLKVVRNLVTTMGDEGAKGILRASYRLCTCSRTFATTSATSGPPR